MVFVGFGFISWQEVESSALEGVSTAVVTLSGEEEEDEEEEGKQECGQIKPVL